MDRADRLLQYMGLFRWVVAVGRSSFKEQPSTDLRQDATLDWSYLKMRTLILGLCQLKAADFCSAAELEVFKPILGCLKPILDCLQSRVPPHSEYRFPAPSSKLCQI